MPLILLTNDDGIDAKGLKTLEACLRGLAHICVVAPDEERSAVSHGLTIRWPLALQEIADDHYVLNGTPADCILYSLSRLLKVKPDLVISGINHGANLGDDIMYSGTVAAAREASRHGIPSMAISQAFSDKRIRFKEGAKFVRAFVEWMLFNGLDGGMCLNINIPERKIQGVKITRQGCTSHFAHYNSLSRPDDYEPSPSELADKHKLNFILDYRAIHEQYVSITPLQRDQTDYTAAESLIREAPNLFQGFTFR